MLNEMISRNSSMKSRDVNDIKIIWVNQLVDRKMLTEYIIQPLIEYGKKGKTAQELAEKISADDFTFETDIKKLESEILDGKVAIMPSFGTNYIMVNFKAVEHKSIESPRISYTLRGPKDSFTENLDVNLALIRYRIKDSRLQTTPFKVGERTQTNVAMLYLQDVANEDCVQEVSKRISEIKIDSIIESGELQQFLTEGKWQLFPQMGLAERSDMAAGAILEGKIILLVEGSGLALIIPKTFSEYLASGDDLYDDKFFGLYSKLLRYFAVLAMFVLMPLYVAIVSFNTEILSNDYTIKLASLRSGVPFSALVEALILTLIIELLRESLLRVPKEIGSAIGLAGGVILGQAMTEAGLFSTIGLIIATISLLCSFIMPDWTIANPFRILQVFLIIMAGWLGLLGVAVGLFVIVVKMISTTSFGVPFLAPSTPFNITDFFKSFYYSKTDTAYRPQFLSLKDKKRK